MMNMIGQTFPSALVTARASNFGCTLLQGINQVCTREMKEHKIFTLPELFNTVPSAMLS